MNFNKFMYSLFLLILYLIMKTSKQYLKDLIRNAVFHYLLHLLNNLKFLIYYYQFQLNYPILFLIKAIFEN